LAGGGEKGFEMRLQMQGVIGTGDAVLDQGITDLEVAVIDGVVHLYSSTGRNGGLASYTVGADGEVTMETSVIFPPNITGTVSDKIVLTDVGGEMVILYGETGTGLRGYSLDGGVLGSDISIAWNPLITASIGGNFTATEAMIELSDRPVDGFPGSYDCSQIVDLAQVTVGGVVYVLGVCGVRNGVTAFAVDPDTGALTERGTMGAEDGLGINAPTALEVIQLGGKTYVLIGASGTSSISVMELRPNGALVPTDHVIDNGSTRFAGLQTMASAVSGDHAFVVAGGADGGVTLFLLLPDGMLLHLQTLADSLSTTLDTVTAIEMVINGDTLHVFVGSQNDSGVTQFTIDLGSLGVQRTGTRAEETLTGTSRDDILIAVGANDTLQGGGGDDVLVAGSDQTRMSGGGGADIFVIREGSGTSYILDFQRGFDSLDLSDLPMLRDLSQLTITPTATGARIEYRGHVIFITSADGEPLRIQDLFPQGLIGGDHFPYIPPEDEIPVGIVLTGTNRNDVLTGTDGSDTISGGLGHDTLGGGDGHDLMDGGKGRDLIDGGRGNDTLTGGGGGDTLAGGAGDDSLEGGGKGDKLSGGAGNDSLSGGTGKDVLRGGAGEDLLDGGKGKDKIYGDDGDDAAFGGGGNDRIWGGDGADTLNGGDGDDWLKGGRGNDVLRGDDGNDRLFGNDGDDLLFGGEGNDRLLGMTGNDTLSGEGGDDLLRGGQGRDSLRGGAGNDILYGDEGDDVVAGDAGDDWLSGGAGNDTVGGGAGNDTLRGGAGNDILWGSWGADVFEFYGGDDTGRIMDFTPADGDTLRIDDDIWMSLGTLTPQDVVDRFGSLDASGNLVLDFTDLGGTVIILNGFDDFDALVAAIEFM